MTSRRGNDNQTFRFGSMVKKNDRREKGRGATGGVEKEKFNEMIPWHKERETR